MGWLADVIKKAGKMLDKVAGSVQRAVDAAGDFLADLPETAGSGIQAGCNALGSALKAIPPVVVSLRWLGGVVAALSSLAGVFIKAVMGILSGLLGGLLRVPGGLFSLNAALFRKGLLDIFSPLAGALILTLGTFWALVQQVFLLQNFARSLTPEERQALQSVFCGSLALYNIRLIEGRCGLFGINERAFTLGNIVYLKGNDTSRQRDLLVHECVHVWQYQHCGPRYAAEALGAQWRLPNAYDWETERLRGNLHWQDFNREAQAKLLDDIWSHGSLTLNGNTAHGSGCFFTCDDPAKLPAAFRFSGREYTALALEAVDTLRKRASLRLSKLL